MGKVTLSQPERYALERAMDCEGIVRRAGGYGGDNSSVLTKGFASAKAVDELINKGMLRSGVFFNVYEVTQRGWNYLARSGARTLAR